MSFAAKLARLFLAAALLIAQQSALAHQIWHFAAAPAQHAAHEAPQDTDSSGKPLCDLHTALGSVLGALDSAAATQDLTAAQADAVPAAVISPARAAVVPPSSRGPPTLR